MESYTASSRVRNRIAQLGLAGVRPELMATLVADESRRLRARWIGVGIGSALVLATRFATHTWRTAPSATTVILVIFTIAVAAAFADVVVSLRSVPAPLDSTRRVARLRPVTVSDYLAPTVIWITRGLAAAAVLGTLGVGALTLTGRFDLPTIVRGGGPLATLVALALLVVFEVTARRVVTQPEPASADDELLWADARRADVLSHLASPVGVMGFGALLMLALSIDPAASEVAMRTTGDSPDWVLALILLALFFSLASLVLVAVMTMVIDRTQPTWFLRRLWPDRAGGTA